MGYTKIFFKTITCEETIKPAYKDDQSPFLTALQPKETLPLTSEFQKVDLSDKFILFEWSIIIGKLRLVKQENQSPKMVCKE